MPFNFTTGPANLPDVGLVSYNGCTFSPLFESNISGVAVKDNAHRTVKLMEYTITADGYVTLNDNSADIGATMTTLRSLLTVQGAPLVYRGRGFDLVINSNDFPAAGAAVRRSDVAWGPVPEVIEFQPLGGGRSAKIRWQVKVRVPDGHNPVAGTLPLLQFNCETTVSYGEDGYSSLSIRGTMEIALNRITPRNRRADSTVDDYRPELDRRIANNIDLSRFRMTRREIAVSRDKRTMEWDFEAEEKPYMDLPPFCNIARGSYNVRPAKAGMGLCTWLCTLRSTYTVRADFARRNAWWAFLDLLRMRMAQSRRGNVSVMNGNQNPPAGPGIVRRVALQVALPAVGAVVNGAALWNQVFGGRNAEVRDARSAWLFDFSFDEGTYLDSKTISFSATWRLATTFSHILLASGLWTRLPETDARGNNLWATSMRDVSGAQSWLSDKLDPNLDAIVDFGGG